MQRERGKSSWLWALMKFALGLGLVAVAGLSLFLFFSSLKISKQREEIRVLGEKLRVRNVAGMRDAGAADQANDGKKKAGSGAEKREPGSETPAASNEPETDQQRCDRLFWEFYKIPLDDSYTYKVDKKVLNKAREIAAMYDKSVKVSGATIHQFLKHSKEGQFGLKIYRHLMDEANLSDAVYYWKSDVEINNNIEIAKFFRVMDCPVLHNPSISGLKDLISMNSMEWEYSDFKLPHSILSLDPNIVSPPWIRLARIYSHLSSGSKQCK